MAVENFLLAIILKLTEDPSASQLNVNIRCLLYYNTVWPRLRGNTMTLWGRLISHDSEGDRPSCLIFAKRWRQPFITEASLPYTAIKRVNKYSISDDPRRWAARFDSPGDVILGSRAGRRWRVAYGRVNVRRAVRRTPLISCEPAQNLTSNVSTSDNQVDGSHLAVLTSRSFIDVTDITLVSLRRRFSTSEVATARRSRNMTT